MRSVPFKRSRWAPGVVYGLPLTDGSFGYVQAISQAMTNVIDVAVLRTRTDSLPRTPPAIDRADVVALLAVWRQNLNRGDWAALGVAPVVVPLSEVPNQAILATGTTLGVTVSDGGVLLDLISAWHGLSPWNLYADENYFDAWLAPGVARPPGAVFLTAEERAALLSRH